MGAPERLKAFAQWCESLLKNEIVRKVIAIAGNHDFLFQHQPSTAREILKGITYLEDSETEWENIRIYGTPWQPWFYDWAFQLRTEGELEAKFASIPAGVDVLLTHGPPKGILDRTIRGASAGSIALCERIKQVRPRLVVFGHIHESYGVLKQDDITYVNASSCDVRNRLIQSPIVLEW